MCVCIYLYIHVHGDVYIHTVLLQPGMAVGAICKGNEYKRINTHKYRHTHRHVYMESTVLMQPGISVGAVCKGNEPMFRFGLSLFPVFIVLVFSLTSFHFLRECVSD